MKTLVYLSTAIVAANSLLGTVHAETLGASIGVYAFPDKNQTEAEQQADDGQCFSWAKDQTGVNPINLAASAPAPVVPQSTERTGLRTGVKGAAVGAVVGEIADDDAGKGAGIGGVLGAVRGARHKHENEERQQAIADAQAQASQSENLSDFKKAYSACMEGKGYTVK